jgi:hypothetical protein
VFLASLILDFIRILQKSKKVVFDSGKEFRYVSDFGKKKPEPHRYAPAHSCTVGCP